MRFTLQMRGRQVLVLSRDRFIEFDSQTRAAEWIADYVVSPHNLFTLRASLAADPRFQGLLRFDLADLIVELGRLLLRGELRSLFDLRDMAPWRWKLPQTPSFDVGEASAEPGKSELTEIAEESEEQEDEYEEVKPEPVIPPEYPRLAKREADAVDFAARKMGTQLDLMRYVGEESVPESAVAKAYPDLAERQAGALDEAVADAAGTLEGLGGTTFQKPESTVAEAMPQMARGAGDAVKSTAGQLEKKVDSLGAGAPFDRPPSAVAPVVVELAESQGSNIREQAQQTGQALDALDGPPASEPSPGTVGPALVTAAGHQGRAIRSKADDVGGTLDPLNQGEIEPPPTSQTKSVFRDAADGQANVIAQATKKSNENLDALAATLDERADVPDPSSNAAIFRADSVAAGQSVGEAADRTARTLDSMRPDDPKAEAAEAVASGGGPMIKLEGPAGLSLEGLLFRVRVGGEELVFLSDAEGIVRLTGVPEDGYDILGVEDHAGLEVVDVRSSPMAPPAPDDAPTG